MSPKEFCYWLQGYIELQPELTGLSDKQLLIVAEHLALVFRKVTEETYRPVQSVPFQVPMWNGATSGTGLTHTDDPPLQICQAGSAVVNPVAFQHYFDIEPGTSC